MKGAPSPGQAANRKLPRNEVLRSAWGHENHAEIICATLICELRLRSEREAHRTILPAKV